nr:MAG TPA: hypothetical protein [Caudoviricetes sp.]
MRSGTCGCRSGRVRAEAVGLTLPRGFQNFA